jgi:hypothetical protein
MEGELIERLHRLGLQWIEKLEFEVARSGRKNQASGDLGCSVRSGSQQIHSSVEEVASPLVRDALERVLRAYALSGSDDGEQGEAMTRVFRWGVLGWFCS